ncbi:hypothetical protein ACFO1B_33940 [Dactylosporangium siamense]|uniref:Tat (Twin-arginine translocation) pathway signal sequence n=1 Tax=Dactylosporangium siamense TaxID=685454 RepID=A0A919PCS7_9ACTN|nr:hypothetical protein [Dactylosporangium siamense]GIG42391.1 hypothetical protein Dsi01nite_004320 [Dactylosporangium siamense]
MHRRSATLAGCAVALVVAFVVAPPALAGVGSDGFTDERDLIGALHAAFTGYWRTGGPGFTPDLERVVDYWFRYHVAKAAIAALLLAVLVALGARLWQAYRTSGGAAVATAGAAVTVLALSSLTVVMANVQGAAAPFASLLPMLLEGPVDWPADQIRQQLAGDPHSPALTVIIDDYAWYHTVMAVVATVVALALAALSVASWRRFVRARDRRVARAAFGVLLVLSTLAVAVVAVANTTVSADPLPGLRGFFDGGW